MHPLDPRSPGRPKAYLPLRRCGWVVQVQRWLRDVAAFLTERDRHKPDRKEAFGRARARDARSAASREGPGRHRRTAPHEARPKEPGSDLGAGALRRIQI